MPAWLPTFVSVALLLASGAIAAPKASSPYVLHESRPHVPGGWSHSHKHEADSVLPLRFGLSQNNLHLIDDFINDVSHPESSNYGKHWSPDEVAAKFAPSRESIVAVTEWLVDSGFDLNRIKLTQSKSWIEVNATVAEAEQLLKADYHVYKHSSGRKHHACDSYQVPAHVQPHIDLITPTVHFDAIIGKPSTDPTSPPPRFEEIEVPKFHKRKRASGTTSAHKVGVPGAGFFGPKSGGVVYDKTTDLGSCDTKITPDCLRALYGLNGYTPKATSKNSYGIVEYTPQAYIQGDIDLFAAAYQPNLKGKRPVEKNIDGGVRQTSQKGFNYNGESNLDLQYGMSLVTPAQNVTLYQVGDLVEGASFNNLLDALDKSYCTFEGGDDPSQDGIYPDTAPGGYTGKENCGTVKPTYVISTSYGYNEADLTRKYTARQCAEYAKLGLMGTTVLYSSGDYGVAGNGDLCLNPNGTQTTGGKIFNPTFPGTCPYVTSVGATEVNPGSSVYNPESACEKVIYSGGGFSNYFAIPSYQKTQVKTYMDSHTPSYSHSIYNATGKSRAYPDIAANGANYAVSIDGNFTLVYGTSAASPVVGAILTLINDARLAANKKPIGFINPTIYSSAFASAFNDVTNGTNPGCGTAGFKTAPGWDPVTGLGTPNFPKLKAAWLKLP